MSIIPLQDLVMIQKNLKRKIETVFVAKNLFRFRELNKTKMNKRFCSVCLYDEHGLKLVALKAELFFSRDVLIQLHFQGRTVVFNLFAIDFVISIFEKVQKIK